MVRWPEMDTKNNQTGYATAVTKRTRTYVYTFVFEALWARNFEISTQNGSSKKIFIQNFEKS